MTTTFLSGVIAWLVIYMPIILVFLAISIVGLLFKKSTRFFIGNLLHDRIFVVTNSLALVLIFLTTDYLPLLLIGELVYIFAILLTRNLGHSEGVAHAIIQTKSLAWVNLMVVFIFMVLSNVHLNVLGTVSSCSERSIQVSNLSDVHTSLSATRSLTGYFPIFFGARPAPIDEPHIVKQGYLLGSVTAVRPFEICSRIDSLEDRLIFVKLNGFGKILQITYIR